MSLQVVVVALLSLVAAGAHALPSNLLSYHAPAPSYHAPRPTYAPKPSYTPRPSYHAPAQYADAHPQYNSQYAVKDDYAGLNFGAQEARDGYDTQGSYSVLLPDGRLQTVTYYVNGDSGYVAEVTYEGEAQYPAQGYGHQPSYGHAPAPSYSPRPSYGYN